LSTCRRKLRRRSRHGISATRQSSNTLTSSKRYRASLRRPPRRPSPPLSLLTLCGILRAMFVGPSGARCPPSQPPGSRPLLAWIAAAREPSPPLHPPSCPRSPLPWSQLHAQRSSRRPPMRQFRGWSSTLRVQTSVPSRLRCASRCLATASGQAPCVCRTRPRVHFSALPRPLTTRLCASQYPSSLRQPPQTPLWTPRSETECWKHASWPSTSSDDAQRLSSHGDVPTEHRLSSRLLSLSMQPSRLPV
jgi:hypothetical protein